jgi:hypothetical protein
MSKLPVIPNCRTLDDVKRGMDELRTYFAKTLPNTPTVATKTTNTTNNVSNTLVLSTPMPDVGGTTKKGRIQIRFTGLNPDGSDQWQLEVVTVP